MNLLVLGPQGSGKGTQAARISAAYGIPHVSTGDMFRAAMAARSELGLRIKPIYDRGDLVPDDLTVALIRARLGEPDASRGFVLDGFPRTLVQAEALDAMLAEIGRGLDAVLFFDLDDETARGRALSRAWQEHRGDDTDGVIAHRLAVYHEQTEPLVEYYRAREALVGLHAERSIEAVFAEIQDALEVAAKRRPEARVGVSRPVEGVWGRPRSGPSATRTSGGGLAEPGGSPGNHRGSREVPPAGAER